jgi:nitrite reductase/ring-hydroxylating ferredoxin subunit
MTPEVRLVPVANAAGLGTDQSLPFAYELAGQKRRGFLLRHRDGFFAYENRCPHWGVDLDLGDGRYYDAGSDRIYCKNHGALFVPQTGVCDHGPCRTRALTRFETRVSGRDVVVFLRPVAGPGERSERSHGT